MPNTSEVKMMFNTILSIQSMDYDNINRAKELFNNYKDMGIIKEGNFEDMRWQLTDEYSHVGLYFGINEFMYKKYYEKTFRLSMEWFQAYIKPMYFILWVNWH